MRGTQYVIRTRLLFFYLNEMLHFVEHPADRLGVIMLNGLIHPAESESTNGRPGFGLLADQAPTERDAECFRSHPSLLPRLGANHLGGPISGQQTRRRDLFGTLPA